MFTVEYKWKRCSKKNSCKQYGQVKCMANMTKWPVQKHTEHHKTRSIERRNRHSEITIFVFCGIFWVFILFFIFNYLKDFSKNVDLPPWYCNVKHWGGLNKFSAAANLTLSQHIDNRILLMRYGLVNGGPFFVSIDDQLQ